MEWTNDVCAIFNRLSVWGFVLERVTLKPLHFHGTVRNQGKGRNRVDTPCLRHLQSPFCLGFCPREGHADSETSLDAELEEGKVEEEGPSEQGGGAESRDADEGDADEGDFDEGEIEEEGIEEGGSDDEDAVDDEPLPSDQLNLAELFAGPNDFNVVSFHSS